MSTAFLTRATLFAAVLVGGVGTSGDSPALDLQLAGGNLHLSLQAASVLGTADVKVQFAQSPDNTNWDAYADNPDIVASTLLAKPGNPEGFNQYPMPGPLARYLKCRITGVALNAADTLATLYAFWQEGDR